MTAADDMVVAGSAIETATEAATASATRDAAMWLPASALQCYEGNARLRSWLTEPGLLTQRVRDACGAAFHLVVVQEYTDTDGRVREIELAGDGRAWIFAQTRVPRGTLQRHPWLAQIGGRSLGEALAGHGDITRSDFEFARLMPDHPVIARALERSHLPPQPLWTRRSRFAVAGDPFVLLEVFMPLVSEQG